MNPLQSRLRRNNTTLEKKDNKEECSLDNIFFNGKYFIKKTGSSHEMDKDR
jgi:hypothetical protein